MTKVDHTKRSAQDALTDEQIVARVLEGDTHLFGMLYDRLYKKVYFKCLTLSRNDATAQDLTHDVFIKVFGNLSKYKGTGLFVPWVNTIATNYCYDFLRKEKRISIDDFDAIVEEKDWVRNDIAGGTEPTDEENMQRLSRAIEELSVSDKMLLMMKYYDDTRIEEIAEQLQLGPSAVKMRLSRIRDKLRLHMQIDK